MKYYLSIDAGTSVIKVVLFNENFKVKFKLSTKNVVIKNSQGKSEINMNSFWTITSQLIKNIMKISKIEKGNIISIGITGNMVGVWPVNNNGVPVRNAILWNDTRSKQIFKNIEKKNPKIYQKIFHLSGSIVQFGCTIPVIKWLDKYEKKTIQKTKYFLTCKDWLRFNLTNNFYNDHTERAVAPGNIFKAEHSLAIFKLLNLNKKIIEKFPKVKQSHEIGGYVTNSASKLIGVKEGTPVIIGAGDVPSSAIGVGAVFKGMTSTIIGTTCHNFLVCDRPMFKPKDAGLLFYSPNHQWLRTMINVAGTTNFDWVIENFYQDQLLNKDKNQIIKMFEKKTLSQDLSKNDLIFLPYLNYGGTISPYFNLNTRAEIFGLLPHHQREDILLAAYQGLAFSIRDCYDSMDIKINNLYLSGGGSSSIILPQIISDILQVKVTIPDGSEFGAKGIAYLSAVALGKYNSLQDIVKKNNKVKKIYIPNKGFKSYYQIKYLKYLNLRKSLLKIW